MAVAFPGSCPGRKLLPAPGSGRSWFPSLPPPRRASGTTPEPVPKAPGTGRTPPGTARLDDRKAVGAPKPGVNLGGPAERSREHLDS